MTTDKLFRLFIFKKVYPDDVKSIVLCRKLFNGKELISVVA